MTALAALLLSVAVLPASVMTTTVLSCFSMCEEFAADRGKIALESFEPGIEFLGITVGSLAIPDDFLFAPLLANVSVTNATSVVGLDDIGIGGTTEAESPLLAIIRRLAGLSMNPGVWLSAFAPAVWSVLIWQVWRPRPRHSRRHEYRRLPG